MPDEKPEVHHGGVRAGAAVAVGSRLSTEMARSSSHNEVQARRKGRVTAKGNAQLAALKAREDELVDGRAELDTLAIVVVSARDEAELDERSKALERAAQRCGGARVRPLDRGCSCASIWRP